MAMYENPFLKKLGILPMQQQEKPLQGIFSPQGLTTLGASLLAGSGQGMGDASVIGNAILGTKSYIDQYNDKLNEGALRNASYNLNLANSAADYDVKQRQLGMEGERLDIARAEALKPSIADTLRQQFMQGYQGGQTSGQQPQGILPQPQNQLEMMAALANPSQYLMTKMQEGGKDQERRFGAETTLRKEYDTQTKDYKSIADNYSKIQSAAANPSPAGDISLIFGYMKLLDPSSTVREGEYATAQQAGSIPTQILAQYNKAVKGETLTDSQRQDFLGQANNIFQSQQAQQAQINDAYKKRAAAYGLNPENVITEYKAPTIPTTKATGVPSAALDLLRKNLNDPRIKEQFKLKYNIDPDTLGF
jgi:hypothetical protein